MSASPSMNSDPSPQSTNSHQSPEEGGLLTPPPATIEGASEGNVATFSPKNEGIGSNDVAASIATPPKAPLPVVVKKKSMFADSTSSSSSSSDSDDDGGGNTSNNKRRASYSKPISRVGSVAAMRPNTAAASSSSTAFKVTNTANNRNSYSAAGSPDPFGVASVATSRGTGGGGRARAGTQALPLSGSRPLFADGSESDSSSSSSSDDDGVGGRHKVSGSSKQGLKNSNTSYMSLGDAGGASLTSPLLSPPTDNSKPLATASVSRSRFNSVAMTSKAGSPNVPNNNNTNTNNNGMASSNLPSSSASDLLLPTHGLVESASRPISAVECVVYKGGSDFTVTGRQSAKMTIRGKPHHVTTVLARPNNGMMAGGAGGGGGDNFSDRASTYSKVGGGSSNNDSMFFGRDDNNLDSQPFFGGSDPQSATNASFMFSSSSMGASSSAFPNAGGAASSSTAASVLTTSASQLAKHHIVMGFGDEYEGEVLKVGLDWIPHGQGVLQSVQGQHCYVGAFKMKKREGKGKLATPRFVLWGEWKDNRPDTTHSARIDNCLTGERYRGNYRIVTDQAALTAMGNPSAKNSSSSNNKGGNAAMGGLPLPSGDTISKFSQWLLCSSIEYCKFGELVSQNGTRYFGEWFKGQQTGFGVQIFPNGDRYVGLFEKGLYHGNGTYFTYKRPRVCEACVRREASFESNEGAIDAAQAQSLLARAQTLINYNRSDPDKSEHSRARTLAEVYALLTRGTCPHGLHGGGDTVYTYAVTGAGAGGSQEKGFPNCGLAEKLTAIGNDGTVYDGLWEKGCFKGEGTHVTLPDGTRITADWAGVSKASNGHIFGPSMEDKTRKWREHFHWEPLLCAASEEKRDRDFEVMTGVRRQLRFCTDKPSFDTVVASDIVRGSRTIVNAIKMFRRCFYASFGTCGAMHHIGAGGGGGGVGIGAPTSSTFIASPTGGPNGIGGAAPSAAHGTPSVVPIDATKAALGWCKAHRTDNGGCIHLGRGRRITTADVRNALTDIFSFVASVQRYVEELLEDDIELATEVDEKYFEDKAKVAELTVEGGFPAPVGRTASGVGANASNPSSAIPAATNFMMTANGPKPLPAGIVMGSMDDRVFDNAMDAFHEYEGVALLHREVFDTVMREVHDLLHNLYAHAYASENRAVHVALQRLAGITLDDLGVNFGRHSAEEKLFDPYAEATRALEGISRYKSLSGKLKCLRQWSQAIDVSTRLAQVKLLDEQLAHVRSQTTIVTTTTTTTTPATGASTSSLSGPPSMDSLVGAAEAGPTTTTTTVTKVKAIESGSADDLLPIHQYVLMNAAVPNLLVEVKLLLDVTADPHLVDVTSQDSFCITTLQACVSSIPQMDLAIRDESAIVTPSAMFAHRAEEALFACCSLPSDLIEYGYLRDAIAVMLGVLPEFPQLTLPLRLEGPSAFPLDTPEYVKSWVPTLLNALFVHLDGSRAAFQWRQWQEAYKREEGRRKAGGGGGGGGGGKAAPTLPPPPRILLPFAALDAAVGAGGASFSGALRTPLSTLLLEAMMGPFAGVLSAFADAPPPQSIAAATCDDAPTSRSSSMDTNTFEDHLAAAALSSANPNRDTAYPSLASDDGSLEAAVRITMLRDALYTQRKAGLDDCARNAEELIRIASNPSLWPSAPIGGGGGGAGIIGDSAVVVNSTVATTTPALLSGGAAAGCVPLHSLGSGGGGGGNSPASASSLSNRQSNSGSSGHFVEPEGEVSALLRSLAPKPHMWSELYVEDTDLLAYQIKNSIAGGKLFASLNRLDMVVVWYLSLTKEERAVLRFAKKLMVAARTLAAVNVQLSVNSKSLPGLPPMFKRTVEEFPIAAGTERSSSLPPSAASPLVSPPAGLNTSAAEEDDPSSSPPRWVALLELFPPKVSKVEEMKALLAMGARLATLVGTARKDSISAADAAAAAANGKVSGPSANANGTAVLATPTRGGDLPLVDAEGEDDDDDDAVSSNWSLDFEGDAAEEEKASETDAFGCSVEDVADCHGSSGAGGRSAFAATLSQHFALQLYVVHDGSVYADAARALLRADVREKS